MSDLGILEVLLGGMDVKWMPLGDIATIYGGLNGKSKIDFSDGDRRYVPYRNIFANIQVDLDKLELVQFSDRETQNSVRYGDVLFTASSEQREEAGISSAVTEKPDCDVYLNSFSFGVRFNDNVNLTPEFSKYLFRSTPMREAIAKTASGVTRFNISKARFKKILVPVLWPNDPKRSLEAQAEIVRILDALTKLTADLSAELTAELKARKKQYHHYREQLLGFEGRDVEWKTLDEIGEFVRGKRFTKADYVDEGISAIHYGEIYTHYGAYAHETLSKVRRDMEDSLRYAKQGDVVIAGVGETIEDVGKAVAWLGSEKVAIHDDSYAFRHSMNPKFIAYALQTDAFHDQKAKYVSSGKIKRLLIDGMRKVRLPVPYPNDPGKSSTEQARIVVILDKFDALTILLSENLSREIKLRQKQYEYYRDLLLSFPKPEGTAEA